MSPKKALLASVVAMQSSHPQLGLMVLQAMKQHETPIGMIVVDNQEDETMGIHTC
jgi:hypothetical protein